jgi:hypothetical protein
VDLPDEGLYRFELGSCALDYLDTVAEENGDHVGTREILDDIYLGVSSLWQNLKSY